VRTLYNFAKRTAKARTDCKSKNLLLLLLRWIESNRYTKRTATRERMLGCSRWFGNKCAALLYYRLNYLNRYWLSWRTGANRDGDARKAVGAIPQKVNDWLNGRKKMSGEQALRVAAFMDPVVKQRRE
jgi:hypothetical protein